MILFFIHPQQVAGVAAPKAAFAGVSPWVAYADAPGNQGRQPQRLSSSAGAQRRAEDPSGGAVNGSSGQARGRQAEMPVPPFTKGLAA